MMRVWPCELPRSWPRENCSRPSTFAPRRARCHAAGVPMPPRPITMTSLITAALWDRLYVEHSPIGPLYGRHEMKRTMTAASLLLLALLTAAAEQTRQEAD